MDKYTFQPIGEIHSCFPEKFGIPRQAGLVPSSRATITFYPPFNRLELFRELKQFSHIWVHFLFHATIAEGWRATVRPPGLGGQKRVGVFASRSPHRPNHLGMSAVALLGMTEDGALEVSGGDFLDGTPVVDIKPYIPYCDAIEDASGGYSGEGMSGKTVVMSLQSEEFCTAYRNRTGRDLHTLITQVLLADPRPASQRRKKREFGCTLWNVNFRWRVEGGNIVVTNCREI